MKMWVPQSHSSPRRLHTASFWNINIQRTSHDDLTEKIFSLVSSAKLVKWQNVKLHFVIWQKNCLCLTSLDDQIFKSFWKPNPWMNLLEKKKFYYISFHSIFCRLSCFHHEWPQLATILTSFDLSFVTKSKSLIFELKQAIHGGKDLSCKN